MVRMGSPVQVRKSAPASERKTLAILLKSCFLYRDGVWRGAFPSSQFDWQVASMRKKVCSKKYFRVAAVVALFFSVCSAAFPEPGSPPAQSVEASLSQGIARLGYLWPLFVPGRVTSRYGQRTHPITKEADFHLGVDIHVPHGASVRAAKAGEVLFSGMRGGYGNAVILQHDAKSSSLYGHCSRLLVKRGQKVHQGQVIAMVGDTGRATGPHLHFEIRTGSGAVDPLEFWKNHAETSAP